MSNKAPVRIDNVRVSAITDPDPRHDLPNKLEIHLSNDHPIIMSNTGYRQGHIWFGSINEIDWPVKDVVGDRLHENSIAGIVSSARTHIHAVPRNRQSLAPRCIKLSKPRHRRHLTQQTHRIETPRLGHARAPRRKGGPRHVAFDFLHELADPRRGGFGLS